MMNKEKYSINQEACIRMLQKEMDLDYIKEITSLSSKQIKNINILNQSFIGDNDLHLRKKYASELHLYHGYYSEDRTRFYTGVDIYKSDFYKNRYINKGNWKFRKQLDEMRMHYANSLRIDALMRILDHLDYSEELVWSCKLPYAVDSSKIDDELYRYVKKQFEEIEEKKMLINLFEVDDNLKRIAFISNLPDEKIEEFKDKNNMFFKNNKLNIAKLKKQQEIWEENLKMEIAKRSTIYHSSIEPNMKIFSISQDELERYCDETSSTSCESYNIRRNIAENLMEYSHSMQEISEICGLYKFYVNLFASRQYYNRYFEKYYEKYEDEELIKYKV